MIRKRQRLILASLLVLTTILVSACGTGLVPEATDAPDDPVSATAVPPSNGDGSNGSEVDQPFAPQEGDQDLERGEVQIEEMELMIMESYPVQISLHLKGNLPTPCHQLRAKVSEADKEGKVNIDVYSVTDPEQMCAQVLESFEENIPLGSYKEQGVSFWVNGEKVGEY
jgi:hypothetical protein